MEQINSASMGNPFSQFLEIIKLNKSAIAKVAKDEKATTGALVFLVIGASVGPIAQLIFGVRVLGTVFRPDVSSTITSSVIAILATVLTIFITSVVATKLFKGKGDYKPYLRVMGLASALNVLGVVGILIPAISPILGLVVGLWLLVVSYIAIKEVFGLDDTNAVLTIIVTILVYFILAALLASIVVSIGLSAVQGGVGNIDLSNLSY